MSVRPSWSPGVRYFPNPRAAYAAKKSVLCCLKGNGWAGLTVTIWLFSVQLAMNLPTGTGLGNNKGTSKILSFDLSVISLVFLKIIWFYIKSIGIYYQDQPQLLLSLAELALT